MPLCPSLIPLCPSLMPLIMPLSASALLCHHLQVNYYGAPTPLKQIAGISVPDASTLMISPFDKSALKEIEKAINESDVGINPNNDGEKIRLVIPPMTQVQGAAGGKVYTRSVQVLIYCP
jgi:ribosome recycling factor